MKRLRPTHAILLLLIAVAAGYLLGRGGGGGGGAPAPAPDTSAAPAAPAAEAQEWTCSMHPQVRRQGPGQCPICFMDLIPVLDELPGQEGPRVLRMTPAGVALASIRTQPVARRIVQREVRMVGKVDYDETRVAVLTAWVAGRLERLFVDSTGVTVRAGDHLAELYSPELFASQRQLLEALRSADRVAESPVETIRRSGPANAASARQRLRLLGMTEEQIDAVVASGEAQTHVSIHAPIGGVVIHKNALQGGYVKEGAELYTIADLSKVWVMLEAYESDLAWLRYGQDVSFEVAAWPGETFHGRIALIDPVLDDAKRTVRVRVHASNTDGRLKPDMFVSAVVQAPLNPHGRVVDEDLAGKWMCPMHPEVLAGGAGACPVCGMDLVPTAELGFTTSEAEQAPLVIPRTAPLLTGRRAVVYVQLPDREQPTFEGREITLGPRAGDWYLVREGLAEGELVVSQGAFKIDSELQLRARPSMMSSEGVRAPDAFRRQLGPVAAAILPLQEALAADDAVAASDAALEVLSALAAADPGLLEPAARDAWLPLAEDIRSGTGAIHRSERLEEQRAAYERASGALLEAIETFGWAGGPEKLGVFHCPMAFDGRGASWLQAGDTVANPYFGAVMLRCGDRDRLLEQER